MKHGVVTRMKLWEKAGLQDQMSVLKQRVWLLSGRDLLLGLRSSLLSDHLLLARRESGNGGYSGRRVMDLEMYC